MRTAHLFAGAGGGILADLILGHEPIVAVEWDAYACAVLRRQFPGLRVIEGDVRAVDFARELAGVDALCAGFPCTDISAANPNGKGIDGERSGLYREVMRAIDAVRPAWVFLENSPRIRTKGRHIVIGDLVARGYSWRDGILSASDVGAPHRRDRWWLLAHRDRDEPQAGLPVDGGRIEPGDSPAGNGCADVAHANGIIGGSRRASDADEGEGGRDADGGGQRKVYVADAGCRRLSGQNQWEMERTGGTEAVGTSEIVADAGGNGPQDAIQGGALMRQKVIRSKPLRDAISAPARGKLNAEWVCWLMGWPLDHTNLPPDKRSARKEAQKKVSLAGQKCSRCGSTEKLNRHHRDYNRPLEVTIICRECHMRDHKEEFEKIGKDAAAKRWAGKPIEATCPCCGAVFRFTRPRQKTCSRSCGNKMAWLRRGGDQNRQSPESLTQKPLGHTETGPVESNASGMVKSRSPRQQRGAFLEAHRD